MSQQPDPQPGQQPEPLAPAAMVRLLINQVASAEDGRFTDNEIAGFLAAEGGAVKLAAAQAIDVIASNAALVLLVIEARNLQTDGAKVADSLRKHAASLRDQHYRAVAAEQDAAEDDGYFGVVDLTGCQGYGSRPELTGWGY